MKRFATIIFGILVYAFTAPTAFAQNYVRLPLDLGGAGSLVTSYGRFSGNIQIRPIGWSPDGKFAFIKEHSSEFRGMSTFFFTIIDAVEDTVVYEFTDDMDDWSDEELSDMRSLAAISWDRVADTVTDALVEHRIDPESPVELRRFPDSIDGEDYGCIIETLSEFDPYNGSPYGEAPYPDTIASYSVTLFSPGRGEKQVTFQDEVYAVAEKSMQFEMTPAVGYRFYGSNLSPQCCSASHSRVM